MTGAGTTTSGDSTVRAGQDRSDTRADGATRRPPRAGVRGSVDPAHPR
jgi:hypothetical protein